MADERDGSARTAPSLLSLLARWRLFTIAAFTCVAISVVALFLVSENVYGPRVRRSVESTRVVREFHEAMLNQETGLRGYMLTGDERFLEPYEQGRTEAASLGDVTRRLASSANAELTVEMELAEAAWVDTWVPRALAFGEGTEAERSAGADALLLEGKELFDRYRHAEESLIGVLVAQREAALDGQSSAVVRTTSLAVGIATLVTLASLWRGRALQRLVQPSLAGILDDLDRVAAGDLSVPPSDRVGPAELVVIQHGIASTARALQRSQDEVVAQSGRLQVQNEQLGEVLHLAREVAGSLNLRYVVRGVAAAASKITAGRVVVWLREPGAVELVAVADSAEPTQDPSAFDAIPLGEGPVGRAARFGRTVRLRDEASREGLALAVPMVVGAEVVGVLEVFEVHAALPAETLGVLEALAIQAATAVGAARVHEHTEELAHTDALTGLPNRRRLEHDLAQELAISIRHGRPLGFAMLDVDHFKAYNDQLGHQAADVALQALAHLLMASVRTGDTVYRYGGEELALVLRETDAAGARHHAERLRAAIEHHFAAPSQPRRVTVSIGVAAMPEHASTLDQLVAAADAALYAAKQAGRNRVCTAQEPSAILP